MSRELIKHCSWSVLHKDICLLADEVHAWFVPLDVPENLMLSFQRSLDPTELRRVSGFRFDIHRKRYIARHGWLREILGDYLSIHPQEIQFTYNPYGKPFLFEKFSSRKLNFNISSSIDVGLLAFTLDRRIGVDIEKICQMFDFMEIINRFFSANEIRDFQKVDPEHQLKAFYCTWVRKEAYVKAHGEGLSLSLKQFDVPVVPYAPADILHVEGEPGWELDWSIMDLNPVTGYVGAVAVRGKNLQFRYWTVLLDSSKGI